MSPTRRRCVRGLGGAGVGAVACLAGCASDPPGGDDGNDSDDGGDSDGNESESDDSDDGPSDPGDGSCPDDGDPGGTRPEGTGGPGVSLRAVDDPPELPVEPAVEVVREAATPEHPPRLRTTLANTGAERVRVGEGRAVHFEYVSDACDALVLLPGGDEYPAEPDCWRLTDDIAVTEEYRTFAIDAGETSDRSVDLYATPGGDACLPVGEYRFETTIAIVADDAEPQSSADWGFSVVLE